MISEIEQTAAGLSYGWRLSAMRKATVLLAEGGHNIDPSVVVGKNTHSVNDASPQKAHHSAVCERLKYILCSELYKKVGRLMNGSSERTRKIP